MQNEIIVRYGTVKKIAELTKSSITTVRYALRGVADSEKVNEIRKTAIETFGGIEVGSPMDIIHSQKKKILDTNLINLLSDRSFYCLHSIGIDKVRDIAVLRKEDLAEYKNITPSTIEEIDKLLESFELSWGMAIE